ncbi:MAG: sigma-54 interaction domain-containing protein [Solirubrobacterales bacterium]
MLTHDMVAGLGARILARLVLEQAERDPALGERLRALLAPAEPAEAGDPAMMGSSPAMVRLRRILERVAATDAPVLITGESGTGKELAAAAIHRGSARAAHPFVAINCAALPDSLIASELFGHEKGAFTGADQRRIGRIQAAEGGTLFLDEVGDLPLELQAHLLRFLQEGTIDRLGGHKPIPVDVRVVAATNLPLRRAVAEGRFRQDLFFRLNVLSVEVPPLRERGGDVERLAEHFLTRFAAESSRPVRGLAEGALALIRRHPWPGNVRELMAAMRRAAVMADGPLVEAEDLGLGETVEDGPSLLTARRVTEERLIRETLAGYRGNVKRTAEHLGVSRVTLYRLMEKHGIR